MPGAPKRRLAKATSPGPFAGPAGPEPLVVAEEPVVPAAPPLFRPPPPPPPATASTTAPAAASASAAPASATGRRRHQAGPGPADSGGWGLVDTFSTFSNNMINKVGVW